MSRMEKTFCPWTVDMFYIHCIITLLFKSVYLFEFIEEQKKRDGILPQNMLLLSIFTNMFKILRNLSIQICTHCALWDFANFVNRRIQYAKYYFSKYNIFLLK